MGHGMRSRVVMRRTALLVVVLCGAVSVGRCGVADTGRRDAILSGPISHVRDGDTIEINQIAVRLRGITCDESGALAEAATARVQRLQSKTATCRLNGERNRDRLIGWCAVDGQDIGALLVAAGLCGRCARYDPEETYTALARAVDWKGTTPSYCVP